MIRAGTTDQASRNTPQSSEANDASVRLSLDRVEVCVHVALVALALTLGLIRLFTGPWYHLYNPLGGVLLEGWPAEWEAAYFTVHLPTFSGDGPPQFGIANVQYRTLLNLYLAGTLYAWTGSAFWSLAAVDLLLWCLAGIAAYHAALRLGVSRVAAALGATLLVTSPLLVSNMWTHVLHVAEFASMPIGLWAALAILDVHDGRGHYSRACGDGDVVNEANLPIPVGTPEQGNPAPLSLPVSRPMTARSLTPSLVLATRLGLLLLVLSLLYQYQWFIAPLLPVLLLPGDLPKRWLHWWSPDDRHAGPSRAERSWWRAQWPAVTRRLEWGTFGPGVRGAGIVAGAIVCYLLGTFVVRGVLAAAGLNQQMAHMDAVARPEALTASWLEALRTDGIRAVLPRWEHLQTTLQVFHPLVFLAGLLGLTLAPWRTRVLAALSLIGALFALTLYVAPWSAMSAYPFIYLGAGVLCVALGRLTTHLLRLVGLVRTTPGAGHGRLHAVILMVVTLACAITLFWTTNRDLAGDPAFARQWWRYYSEVPAH